jgi:hypothetical protein
MEHRALTVPHHPRLLFQFLGSIRHLVGLLGGGIGPHKASTYTGQHNTERRRQTSMPQAGSNVVNSAINMNASHVRTATELHAFCMSDGWRMPH